MGLASHTPSDSLLLDADYYASISSTASLISSSWLNFTSSSFLSSLCIKTGLYLGEIGPSSLGLDYGAHSIGDYLLMKQL
jgi:hypothetical protein